MLDKKAQFEVARKSIYWMIAGFVITMVVIGFIIILTTYKHSITEYPPELNAEFISLRFTNIPECFAYEDERVHPGIIDLNKFTTERMNSSCYHTKGKEGHKDYNFALELPSVNKTIRTNNYFEAAHFTLKRKVFVRNGDNQWEDTLLIHTQISIPKFLQYDE